MTTKRAIAHAKTFHRTTDRKTEILDGNEWRTLRPGETLGAFLYTTAARALNVPKEKIEETLSCHTFRALQWWHFLPGGQPRRPRWIKPRPEHKGAFLDD